jgi:HSP20 family protein
LLMSEQRRRHLRDVLDELDRYFDEFERTVQDSVRASFSAGDEELTARRPVVTGVTIRWTPEGKPSVQFFGDRFEADGLRRPIYEQITDEREGTLRLIVELPGVSREAIDISAQEGKVVIETGGPGRKYRVEIPMKNEIDPESGTATYTNGILDVVFPIRHKTNKGYRRVTVV